MAMNSQVTMHIAKRDGRSYLAGNYFTPPYKLANITEDKQDPYLHLMLMCSSPGVLDGDRQTIFITLEPNTRLFLHTQSYQRLFRMKTGATQSMDVHVGENAGFSWLPHPCVPHAESIFSGRNRIFLGRHARLLWGEVLTCGRKLTGEVFAFASYHLRTEVYIADRLALLENISLQPALMPVNTLGQLAEYTHQASLLFIEEGRRISPDIREQITAYLSSQAEDKAENNFKSQAEDKAENNFKSQAEDKAENNFKSQPGNNAEHHAESLAAHPLLYGLTEGPASSLIVRLLGDSAEQLYQHLQNIQNILKCKPN